MVIKINVKLKIAYYNKSLAVKVRKTVIKILAQAGVEPAIVRRRCDDFTTELAGTLVD